MADGGTKAIADVQVGETVVATDPVTGQTSPQPVTLLHLNMDEELTDLTVTSSPVAAPDAGAGANEGDGERSTRGPTTTTLYTIPSGS